MKGSTFPFFLTVFIISCLRDRNYTSYQKTPSSSSIVISIFESRDSCHSGGDDISLLWATLIDPYVLSCR